MTAGGQESRRPPAVKRINSTEWSNEPEYARYYPTSGLFMARIADLQLLGVRRLSRGRVGRVLGGPIEPLWPRFRPLNGLSPARQLRVLSGWSKKGDFILLLGVEWTKGVPGSLIWRQERSRARKEESTDEKSGTGCRTARWTESWTSKWSTVTAAIDRMESRVGYLGRFASKPGLKWSKQRETAARQHTWAVAIARSWRARRRSPCPAGGGFGATPAHERGGEAAEHEDAGPAVGQVEPGEGAAGNEQLRGLFQ